MVYHRRPDPSARLDPRDRSLDLHPGGPQRWQLDAAPACLPRRPGGTALAPLGSYVAWVYGDVLAFRPGFRGV